MELEKNITEKLNKFEKKPGCYMFKDKDGEVIYVGKAKNLRSRLSSYFQKNLLTRKFQLKKDYL